MVLFENFETGSINDATFSVQVSEYAAAFLRAWEDHETKTYTSHGSGLELFLLEWLHGELGFRNAQLRWAHAQFRAVHSLPTYDRYIAAARFLLGRRRQFVNVTLQRRGHGLCSDLDAPAQVMQQFCQLPWPSMRFNDSCLRDVLTCRTPIFRCVTNLSEADSARTHQPKRMGLGMVNDIKEGWAHDAMFGFLVHLPRMLWPAGLLAPLLRRSGKHLGEDEAGPSLQRGVSGGIERLTTKWMTWVGNWGVPHSIPMLKGDAMNNDHGSTISSRPAIPVLKQHHPQSTRFPRSFPSQATCRSVGL